MDNGYIKLHRKTLDSRYANEVKDRADELASMMATGEITTNL